MYTFYIAITLIPVINLGTGNIFQGKMAFLPYQNAQEACVASMEARRPRVEEPQIIEISVNTQSVKDCCRNRDSWQSVCNQSPKDFDCPDGKEPEIVKTKRCVSSPIYHLEDL